ncbi:MAG TPA: nucleoside phosphorylase [Chitinophagaceae bacterium]|jgi:uridine phosphorylase|nr:nucleoside phosphorylase [Chitinophagaceae bacterium]
MHRIQDSELIINDRGAIYHLDLRPEEMANTIITVGDPGRVQEVSRHFDRIEHRSHHREFITHTGYIGKKRISVVSTGIGPDNIDIVMNELDAVANIDFETRHVKQQHNALQVFRLGTSGSLQEDIDVDSMVAGTHGLGLDNLMHFYRPDNHEEERHILQAFITHTQLTQPFSTPYIASASATLLRHFATGYHHGITVTCPGFYGPQGRVLRLGLARPDLVNLLQDFRFGPHRISNFEMETSAIYGMGKLLGHQCLSLNVIVANRIKKAFSKDSKAAVFRLIEKSLDIIQGI